MDQNNNATFDASCSFSLYPVCDNHVSIILNALRQADMSEVTRHTDNLETCLRGQIASVFTATESAFLHSVAAGQPVVFRGTFSMGGSLKNIPFSPPQVDILENNDTATSPIELDTQALSAAPVTGKLAIYPLFGANERSYADYIARCIEKLQITPLEVRQTHHAIRFDGALHSVWQQAEQCLCDASGHTVMELCVLANSRFSAHSQKGKTA